MNQSYGFTYLTSSEIHPLLQSFYLILPAVLGCVCIYTSLKVNMTSYFLDFSNYCKYEIHTSVSFGDMN